ncbi:MAG: insulinase family protein [Candidatus Cloacimonas sp.]|jgi:Zn-dependent M16 (insulinase) family peptidase|nr:insulinase family protein [Candidatus Cloacimonas sp.]
MKKKNLLHGFELIESREIKEIKTTAHRYKHVQSGAELIHYACEDNNKVFNIGFKTVPEDNTGCPHILEHSVLNGSKNFPSKNTFMELIKGSMNTFINAMTSPDMTNYPVASTNDKDFMNLMHVYLDAVFFPKVCSEPNILHQEGWHYELTQEDGELNYRGVVYNEMKGAFSSAESIISRKSKLVQFPDTAYGFESGGDPDAIPELSYSRFLDFYRKYYHPSNSKIALYGDLNIEAALELIDKDYLSQFTDNGIKIDIPLQKAFSKPKKLVLEYPIDEDKDPTGEYYLSLNWTYGSITDVFLPASLNFLVEILMNTPASPLKKAIRDSGWAQDSTASARGDALQPTISITCKKVAKENLEPLAKLITTELKQIVKNGIDKKLVEAVINKMEFFYREAQMQRFPKGLYYIFTTLSPWMHGCDPVSILAFEPLLAELRRALTEPYFENLIDAAILHNKHASEIQFTPVPGLIAKHDAETKAKLATKKKAMTATEIKELVAFTKSLKDWQEEPENTADLEKIPLLSLLDLNPQIAVYPLEKEVWKEFTLLKHETKTNGIVYLKAYFDLGHAEEVDLPWIKLYTQLAGWLNSENYGYGELSNEIDTHTGGIDLQLQLFNSYQTPDDIIPKLVISGKAVKDKTPKLMELAAEYSLKPLFDDPVRLSTLIRELKSRIEAGVIRSGISVAVTRMLSPLSQIYHWRDLTTGFAYYQFLCDLVSKLEQGITDIMEELDWIKHTFFTTANLLISLTSGAEELPVAANELGILLAQVSPEAYEPVENHFTIRDFNEGIYAPVQVQSCVKGGNFFRKGYSYSGKLKVLNSILSNNYLYQELRVKGGAYGAMSNFSPSGYQFFASYSDPNLRETLNVYDTVPDFLRGFTCSKREMDKYIIGEISGLDYPDTPEEIGTKADEGYITGFTQEDRQQIRNEVLSTKVEDIRAYADLVEAIMNKNHYAVFGSEAKVKEAAELFNAITPLIK